MIFLDIFRGLQEHGVRYLVVGGLAMSLHGIPRMTADVDLYVDLEKANANRFLAAVKALGFVPGVPVSAECFADPEAGGSWGREKNMLVMERSTLFPHTTLFRSNSACCSRRCSSAFRRKRVSV